MSESLAEKFTVYFKDAEITDTRLMGAVGLHVHWILSDGADSLDLHQFLRYDYDYRGIEFLAAAQGSDKAIINSTVREYFGSLGGKMVPLTERQCRYLGRLYMDNTAAGPRSIPADAKEMDLFSTRAVRLSAAEKACLMRKLCGGLSNDYSVVNFYLMRAFAGDDEACGFLRYDGAMDEDFDDMRIDPSMDLFKNTIETAGAPGEGMVYLSESVVGTTKDHWLVLSEINVEDGKVRSCRKRRIQPVSLFESALVLNRDEYICVFDITGSRKALEKELRKITGNAMNFEHEAGTLYMAMNSDNSHVSERVFRISGDVSAMFFITNADQLLVVSSSDESAAAAQLSLSGFIAAGRLEKAGCYHMDTPVFFDFIDSDYDDFNEFLEEIRELW